MGRAKKPLVESSLDRVRVVLVELCAVVRVKRTVDAVALVAAVLKDEARVVPELVHKHEGQRGRSLAAWVSCSVTTRRPELCTVVVIEAVDAKVALVAMTEATAH